MGASTHRFNRTSIDHVSQTFAKRASASMSSFIRHDVYAITGAETRVVPVN